MSRTRIGKAVTDGDTSFELDRLLETDRGRRLESVRPTRSEKAITPTAM